MADSNFEKDGTKLNATVSTISERLKEICLDVFSKHGILDLKICLPLVMVLRRLTNIIASVNFDMNSRKVYDHDQDIYGIVGQSLSGCFCDAIMLDFG
ncbi:hypothetical protein QE152_g25941 [Popillia japonica]|uniref:Uncharacterized protein n=1 Tax=Popillia japonica TaxID=7064 RepID=A0AAW1JZB5_POPJA